MASSESGSGPASAGAWLREARQQRGLHIAAVAAMLKVPQAKLEALEADRWQELTDMTFVRALAKAVCRTMKVDATQVLALLPRGGERELDVSKGINKPFRERGSRDDGLSMAFLQRPLVWGPALLLLAAAVVYFLPANLLEPAPAEISRPELAASAPAPAPLDQAASMPLATGPVSQGASAAPLAEPAASKLVVAAAPGGEVLPLKIRIKAESWISVTDARGQVLISKLVQPGEDPELVGLLPLKVTIGNVAGTELSLRGSRIDLAARSKDNVARIELN